MDFKMYTQGLVDIINTYENNPDEMVEKIIDFYDTATQNNKLKMAIKSCSSDLVAD